MGNGKLDLNSVANKYGSPNVAKETKEERASRLIREEKDAAHRRWRWTGTYIVVGLGVLVVILVSGYTVAMSRTATADQRQWAQHALVSLASALLGFIGGKKADES